MGEKMYTADYVRNNLLNYITNKGYNNLEFIEGVKDKEGKSLAVWNPLGKILGYELLNTNDKNYVNNLLSVSKTYLDNLVSDYVSKGMLKPKGAPEVTIYARPRLRLITYPKFGKYFVGHSQLRGPRGFIVNRNPNSTNYNLITNNCANSTARALSDISGISYNLFKGATDGFIPIYSPLGVRDLVKTRFSGITERFNKDGSIETIIPMSDDMINRFNKIRLRKNYYENIKQ